MSHCRRKLEIEQLFHVAELCPPAGVYISMMIQMTRNIIRQMLITSGGEPEVFHCVIRGCGLGTRPSFSLSYVTMVLAYTMYLWSDIAGGGMCNKVISIG